MNYEIATRTYWVATCKEGDLGTLDAALYRATTIESHHDDSVIDGYHNITVVVLCTEVISGEVDISRNDYLRNYQAGRLRSFPFFCSAEPHDTPEEALATYAKGCR